MLKTIYKMKYLKIKIMKIKISILIMSIFMLSCSSSDDSGDSQDSDNDGIINSLDNCPNEPGLLSNNGCPADPEADTDNDGIIDSEDDCPTEAGVAANNGCPEPEVDLFTFTYDATENLKDVADFPIGNIVSAGKLASSSSDNTTFKTILNEDFNSITAENDMKPSSMFGGPDPADYNYTSADAIVAYAKENGVRVHGHVLSWHSQQPGWFSSFAGTDAEFETAVMNYVTNTVAHFAETTFDNGDPVVASWDVLNETFEGATSTNPLYTRIPDVRAKVFIAARAGDPDVKLFYNDFNVAGDTDKRAKILDMIADFKSRTPEIPIDGIGMQMHLNHDWPNTDLPISIQDIADTGLLVHISEIDVKINYNGPSNFTLTQELATAQEEQYQRAAYYYTTLVPSAQQYGITVWGFRDTESWLYNNGTDYPLIYDEDFNHKISHRGLINGIKGINPDN